jgi:hypothetical protein
VPFLVLILYIKEEVDRFLESNWICKLWPSMKLIRSSFPLGILPKWMTSSQILQWKSTLLSSRLYRLLNRNTPLYYSFYLINSRSIQY